jgi:hypothetical protein
MKQCPEYEVTLDTGANALAKAGTKASLGVGIKPSVTLDTGVDTPARRDTEANLGAVLSTE